MEVLSLMKKMRPLQKSSNIKMGPIRICPKITLKIILNFIILIISTIQTNRVSNKKLIIIRWDNFLQRMNEDQRIIAFLK